MTPPSLGHRLLAAALCLLLATPLAPGLSSPAFAQGKAPAPPANKELVAVMDLQAIGADAGQASAMSDRLREELLKTGRYILVDREQLNTVLNEQALQQTGCTSSECAVQVGKVLGVRKIVSGRVTKVGENQWLMSANVTNVETAETEQTVSVRYEGTFFAMLDDGITKLTQRIAAAPAVPGARPAAQRPGDVPAAVAQGTAPADGSAPGTEEAPKSNSKWWWIAGGVAVVAAAAAGGGKSSKGASGCTACTSVTAHW
jgi:hypothetical protein